MAEKQKPHVCKGYDIRVQREGSDWRNEKMTGWGRDGALPEIWGQIKEDPAVVSARLTPLTQRTWRADKRRILDAYERLEKRAEGSSRGGVST